MVRLRQRVRAGVCQNLSELIEIQKKPSGQEVRDRLSHPVQTGNIQQLAECWEVTDISILVNKKINISELSTLPARIRGGWGEKLTCFASNSARENGLCNWNSASALSILFSENGTMDKGLQIPRPYVVEIFPFVETEQILINLRLFGFAGIWAGEASAAMRYLLQDGLEWSAGKDREKAEIIDMSIIRHGAETLPDKEQKRIMNSAFLKFITPLSLRRQGAVTADVTALLLSLVNRIKGLARWHDIDLVIDRRLLKGLARNLHYDSRDMRGEGWFRFSNRQKRKIPMEGLSGTLIIEGDLFPFIPYLWLGQDSFVGSHTASGMGRYHLELVGAVLD